MSGQSGRCSVFRSIRRPKFKVDAVAASLAAARQQTQILKSNYEQATRMSAGLDAQVKYNAKRLDDIQKLYASGSNTEFKEQDTRFNSSTVTAQLNVAKATQRAPSWLWIPDRRVNTSVAQIQALLENAEWNCRKPAFARRRTAM